MSASLALARKYRPRNFSELMGQEHVVRALSHALETGRLHQAYLLTGTRGVGKTTIARILAKTLNCETGVTATPCGVCQTCQDIDAGRFPDLIELDAASNTGVDNMREIIDNARYAPTAGRYKVYLIDEVHMLSKSAFNSMLKTLEEPPEHVKFVLATTDPQKIPVTVLSRCLQFALKQFPPERVAEQLHKVLSAEQVPFDAPALRLIGEAAQGSMRDALSITDQAIAFGHGKVDEQQVRQMLGNVDRDFVWRVLDAVVARDAAALNAEVERCFEHGLAADDALAQLARALQRIALAQPVQASVDAADPDAAQIQRLSQALSAEEVQLYYQIALHGRDDLRLAPDEQTALMMTFLRLLAFAPSNGAEPVREATPANVARTETPLAPRGRGVAGEGAGASPYPASHASAPSPSPQPSPTRGKGGADVRLEPITSDNLLAVLRLNPGAIGERMVATNAVSIAQASVSANAVPRAIVAGAGDAAKVVGFIMLYDPTRDPALAARDEARADSIDIWRLMVDFQQQGRGYGAAAILGAARYSVTRPGVTQVRLSYVPREGNPSPFYKAMGFTETGEKDGIEIVMTQPLAALLARADAA